MRKIILASASPRRKELLSQIGLAFEIIPSKKEEVITSTEPAMVVEELSCQKAMDIYEHCKSLSDGQDVMVIGADTVVACDGQILGKPTDREDAIRMIRMIAGREHSVYTGVSVVCDGITTTFSEQTRVSVFAMSEQEIADYVDSGEPMDKAGGYGIQGAFAAYIEKIDGDYSNVVGLPVGRLYQTIKNQI